MFYFSRGEISYSWIGLQQSEGNELSWECGGGQQPFNPQLQQYLSKPSEAAPYWFQMKPDGQLSATTNEYALQSAICRKGFYGFLSWVGLFDCDLSRSLFYSCEFFVHLA